MLSLSLNLNLEMFLPALPYLKHFNSNKQFGCGNFYFIDDIYLTKVLVQNLQQVFG